MKLVLLLVALFVVGCVSAAQPEPRDSGSQPWQPVLPAKKSCRPPIVQNDSGEKLGPADQAMLEDAKKQCRARYSRSPCVVKFIKWPSGGYGVICGEEK